MNLYSIYYRTLMIYLIISVITRSHFTFVSYWHCLDVIILYKQVICEAWQDEGVHIQNQKENLRTYEYTVCIKNIQMHLIPGAGVGLGDGSALNRLLSMSLRNARYPAYSPFCSPCQMKSRLYEINHLMRYACTVYRSIRVNKLTCCGLQLSKWQEI